MASLTRSNASVFKTKLKRTRNKEGLKIELNFHSEDATSPNPNIGSSTASLFVPSDLDRNHGETPSLSDLPDYRQYVTTGKRKNSSDRLTESNHDSENEEDYDLDPSNFQELSKLGEGSVGTVYKVRHLPSNLIMAKKSVGVDPDPITLKQIIRELSFLRKCQSPYIVSFYGAYLDEDEACIAMYMEYCNGGSLDAIYKRIRDRNGRIGEGVLGKIAEAVLNGLVYLHDRRIIHRDVKPSNILVSSQGDIKLCDFGVSGELVNSFVLTFVGTSYYMAPERIQGCSYAVQSDIWSLGLTLLELAFNCFPFPPPGHPPLAIFELLDYIVRMPVPSLSEEDGWSPECCDFVRVCLIKDSQSRPTPKEMLNHPFMIRSSHLNVDLHRWIREVWA